MAEGNWHKCKVGLGPGYVNKGWNAARKDEHRLLEVKEVRDDSMEKRSKKQNPTGKRATI